MIGHYPLVEAAIEVVASKKFILLKWLVSDLIGG